MSTTYTHHSPHHSTEKRQTMTNTTAVKRTTAEQTEIESYLDWEIER